MGAKSVDVLSLIQSQKHTGDEKWRRKEEMKD
jgi:hypothetical protein